MRIIVAPDSFKGSLSALQAAAAMKRGILKIFPTAEIVEVPMADGGEGTVEALLRAAGGSRVVTSTADPLGRDVDADWGMLGDGKTAVVEVAAASGLTLLKTEERNPLIASSYGSGLLIKAALDSGCRKLIIGLGGSATNDAGCGIFRALGARFLDSAGQELPDGGLALNRLDNIDLSSLDPRLQAVEIVIACDVDNPLLGKYGASMVYGIQKGASGNMPEQLDNALARFAEVAGRITGVDAANLPGSGAAGGIAAGFLYFTGARLVSGVETVLGVTCFSELLKNTDIVFTGEGYTDVQTLHGKAPAGIAALALQAGVPVLCISGGFSAAAELLYEKGICVIDTIAPGAVSLEYCVNNAGLLLENAAAKLCRAIAVGCKLQVGI